MDPAALSARLAQLTPDLSRSSTVEPAEDTSRYETSCYHDLIEDGGRPLVTIDSPPPGSYNQAPNRQLLQPWATTSLTSAPQHFDTFSKQLYRWCIFRGCQRASRGQSSTFLEYFDQKARELRREGAGAESMAHPLVKQAIKIQWDREERRSLSDDPDIFSRYIESTNELLRDNGFTQSFKLLEFPKKQNKWTTFVEYLAFELSQLGGLVLLANELQSTEKLQAAKAKVDEQQRLVDWVGSEIRKIEAERRFIGKSSTLVGSKKRRLADDVDSETGGSKAETEKATGPMATSKKRQKRAGEALSIVQQQRLATLRPRVNGKVEGVKGT